jgi:hypothetical protein
MSYFLNDSKVSVSNGLTLEREGDVTNYTAVIPAGTVITGNASWDGKLTLPTVTTVTTSLGSVSTAVEIGSDVKLTFSNAVKVILAGMTGKKALWADSSGSYAISLCADANSTSAGSLTTGECYVDTGADLVIWTYHFTTFGAYTPTVAATASTNVAGGSSYNPDWNKKKVPAYTPAEQNDSNAPVNFTEAPQKGLLSLITGAVIGALGTTGATVAVVFIVAIIIALVVVSSRRKAGKAKKDKKESDEDED